jgi:DNA-binding GntR family transcriptional regulator
MDQYTDLHKGVSVAMSFSKRSVVINLRPLGTQTNLSQEVANRLREAIQNGKLLPGTRLVEREIAEQLGISRMPVREAIQQLVEDGLLIKEPRRGAYVHTYSEKELGEISSLRVVLERFVIERVIANWSEQSASRLESIVDAMAQAAKANDIRKVYELDFEFHHMLWTLTDHSLLLEVVAGLRDRINRFLLEATSALSPDAMGAHIEIHRHLLVILNSGDVQAAQEEISHHILLARDRIKAHYAYLDVPSDGR